MVGHWIKAFAFAALLIGSVNKARAQEAPVAGDNILTCYQQVAQGRTLPTGRDFYVLAVQFPREGGGNPPISRIIDQARFFEGLELQPLEVLGSGEIRIEARSRSGVTPMIARTIIARPKPNPRQSGEYLSLSTQSRDGVLDAPEGLWLTGQCLYLRIRGSGDEIMDRTAVESPVGERAIP